MLQNTSLSDIIAFIALLITALGALLGLIWGVTTFANKSSIKLLNERDDLLQRELNEHTKEFDEHTKELERIENKIDHEISAINMSVNSKMNDMTEKMSTHQDIINTKLNSFHTEIMDRLSKIIEQNNNLEKTILREFINRQTLDKELKNIFREIDSIPCKKGNSGAAPREACPANI